MPSGFHNWSQTAASDATADSAINWAEGQAPSSVNDSARAMMAVLAKWRDDNNGSLTTGGTSTAYTITSNTVFTTLALMNNQTIGFTVNATSGTAPTLNVDSLGAKAIRSATGVDLVAGALVSGGYYAAKYNNSDGIWYLTNVIGTLGPTTITGALTVSTTLAVTGNFTVNTNKFTVTASSGDTLVAGVLSVTGNIAVNTNKFTVTAASGNTAVAGTLAVTGTSTVAAVASSSSVLSSSATAGIGYATGAGGAVTQLTNKLTGVTLNTVTGSITMSNAILNAGSQVNFTLTNSAIAANDVLILNHISGGSPGAYLLNAQCASGSAIINVRNITGGSNLSEAVVIQFAVVKAVTS